MFKKVHLRLTLLCTGITSMILICMTFFYLLVAETNLKNNYYHSFENDVQNIIYNLEKESVISYEWLSKLEAGGKYTIFLEDNDQPILYGNIIENKERKELLSRIKREYESLFEVETLDLSSLLSFHQEFTYVGANDFFAINRQEYHVSYGKIPKEHGYIKVYILCSLTNLYKQIYIQRALFAFINLAALAVLFFFFWHFTKRLLKPIEENQKKQIQFVAAASHELRTPLTVILSSVSALKKLPEKNTKPAAVSNPSKNLPLKEDSLNEKNFCQIIEEEAKRMTRLVNDMLILANGDSQSYSLQLKETEADTLLLNCYEAFEIMAKEKKINLSILLPDTQMPLCKCDPQRIAQVLAILVHNALSYTEIKYERKEASETSMAGQGKVVLKGEYKDNHHYFYVIDNGIGIPDEKKKHIFERFYRVDASRSKKDHFGLGLCIALEIVKEHHGTIRVLDTEGGGSTFIVKL
ncbi:MAG: HAMP domain-containing histidine kinase [Roseburia sp.]|nr:HAMP domain-containing histidine kinase [Roseburia sp.]MCM1279610.1 HAMP domain-containing histidine kinase [Robinsoniella sp.]